MIELRGATAPAFLKAGFYGGTGTGKTRTASEVLAQFSKMFLKSQQVAMYDSEGGAGFVAPLVKKITGKELLVITSRSFSDLLEFVALCTKEKYCALVDSITHPWRSLCYDYLEAKKSRIEQAGGRTETAKLSLSDWGPIKDIWNKFSEAYVYNPVHIVVCGREGDVWEQVENEEGKKEAVKTGTKMKTESELAYEPSLLVQMRLENDKHFAFVAKDRFGLLTGKLSGPEPTIDFFMPHIEALSLGGAAAVKSEGDKVFHEGSGPNWETIKVQRAAILEGIKEDLLIAYPGRGDEDKKAKVAALRKATGTNASWTELEEDHKKWPVDRLNEVRQKLEAILEPKS